MRNLIKKILFTLFVIIIIYKTGYNQTDREFWFAIPKITTDNCQGGGCIGGQPMYLRLAAYDFPAEVIVDMPASGDTLGTFTIPANTDYTLDLTADRLLVEVTKSNKVSKQGIHISSDNLIMAFYEIDENKNAEMWVMKGEHALGDFFYVPMQNLWTNDALPDQPVNAIYVVATEDATDVEITITAASGIYNAGDVISITLDEGEVYPVVAKFYTGADHLGGTKVEVTNGKKVVVITSDDSVGPAGGGGDTNGDQIVPIDYIGYKYVVMNAGGSDKVLIIPSANGTEIFVDGLSQGFFNEGQLIKFDISAVTLIEASEPIWVYHLADFGNEVGGAILPASDGCTGSYDVTIFRTNPQKFILNIMVSFAGIDGFDIKYDDGTSFHMDPAWFVPVDPGDLTGLYVIDDAEKVFGDGYAGGIPKDVATKIVNTLDVFHLGVISTAAARHVKYGYFSDFGINAASVEVIDATIPGNEAKIGCFGDTIQLLARGGTSYEWYEQLTGDQKYLSPSPFIADPVLIDLPVSNPAYYKYDVYVGGDCADTTLTVYVKINPNVEAFFQIDKAIGCAPLNVNIDNLTSEASRFLWDFDGDGTWEIVTTDSARVTDTIYQNQQLSDTVYTTRLYVENKHGCWDLFERNIYVHPEITAGFDQDIDADCNPFDVQFTDTSSGNLNHNYWEFGDGYSTLNIPKDSIQVHTYSNYLNNDTVYTATLITTSPYNCKDTATKDITVHPYIEARFSVSQNVGCAPFDVTVTNLSKGGIDSYSWDFYGDGTLVSNTLLTDTTISYTNTTAAPVDYTLRLVVKNANNCTDTLIRVIRVYPVINADYAVDFSEGCNTLDVVFTNSSTGYSVVDWDFGDGISSNSTAATVNHTYNNYFTHDTIFGFSLHVESDYGCKDDTTGNITVHRTKARFAIDTAEGCSPLNVNITNTSVGSNLSYEWIFGDGTANNYTNNPVSHTYNNTDGTRDDLNLELKLEGTGGCRDSLTLPIIVYSSIDVSYTPVDSTICDSNSISFKPSLFAPIAGTIYDWDFGDGTSSAAEDPVHIYRNLTSAAIVNYPVTLNVETPNGCTDTEIGSINVRPYVRAYFAIDSVQGCSPHGINVDPTDYIGINEFKWDFGDGTPIVTDPNPNPKSHTFPRNTIGGNDLYNVTLEVWESTNNCSDTYTVPVTVYLESKAEFTPMPATDCNPFDITFDGTLAFNASLYNWDFGDGASSNLQNPFHSFVNTTDATVPYTVSLEVTSANGCTHDTSTTISVSPYVNADFDIDISEDCSPFTVTISNNSSGTEYFWFWDGSDLALENADDTSANPSPHTYIHTTGGTRTDSLTLIVGNGNGCYDTLKRAINIHSSIVADFTFSQPDSCTTSAVTFNSGKTFPAASKYSWNFGDGSNTTTTDSIINKQFTNNTTNDTTFTVTLTAETPEGCTDVYSDNVTVYSRVIADFSIPIKANCPPFENAVIENTSIGNNSNTYEWYVDEALVSGSPADKSDFYHTYENSVNSILNYEVKLIATNPHGCTSKHIDTITVYEYVKAIFSMDLIEGCTPLTINFKDSSIVPASTKYTWNFGDGASSGLYNPTHTFYNPSRTANLPYTIYLTVQSPNYCYDDTSMVIDVYHQPLATMYVPTTTSCPPLEAYMDNFNSKGYDSFEWRFGDGSTNNIVDSSLVHSYTSLPDTVKYYDLILWVGTDEGCTHKDSIRLSVFPDVIADFTYDVAGCSPFTSTFTNESSATANFFSWNFADGTTSSQRHPIHRFENTTNGDKVYDVRLFARNEYECSDDTIQPVTVYAQPTALFNPTPVVQTFPEATVWLNSTSNNEPWDYLWEFGDINETPSTSSNQLLFEYPHWGEKHIKLTLTTSYCSDSLTRSVIIYPPKVNADFTTNIDGGCLNEGLEVQFTAAGSAYAEVYNYTWDFGDGETGAGANIYHTYESAGVFYVKMTASSNEGAGEDFEYKTIRVYSNPKASFEVSPKLVMLNTDLEARVEFFNMSECNDTSGCAYVWDFGDGNTRISRDVTHNYSPDPGDVPIKYDISLLVTTAHGCADSLTLYEEVEIIGAGQIAFPNAFTPNGDGLNDTFRPVSEGVIKYEMLLYNRWGELIFTTKDLSAGWDGKIKGKLAKPDVYVWKAMGKFTNGRSFELAGDVTLIR